jgi:nicotinate-nucleotide--dimethylbenzimidazole phosphoribosyltransferase
LSDVLGPGLAWITDPCRALDRDAEQAALARQARLTKPPGALGRLESLAVRLAGLKGQAVPDVDPVHCVLFAADHGVTVEGVSAYPQAVTAQMVRNIAAGGAAVSVLVRSLGSDLEVIDCGVAADLGPIAGVRGESLGPGTGNIAREPAMDRACLAKALAIGRAAAERAAAKGAGLLVAGEMGIGNTTAAAALGCALLGLDAEALTGPGTGLDAFGVARKTAIVGRALARHRSTWPSGAAGDPLAVLADLGGFEIAAIAGCAIRCAQLGIPLLVDGFITTAAVLAACRANPRVRDWLIFAHRSAEPGHDRLLAALDAEPLLDLGLRLGEGSGAALAVPLLRLACVLHAEMSTFDQAGVSGATG